jgi:uncharacterized protein (TIGR02145 family)
MKRTVISTIFISVFLSSIAQDLSYLTGNDVNQRNNKSEFKEKSEAWVDNVTSSAIFNISDNDGNTYNIVKIGNQVWMAENLKTTKFNDGTRIPMVSDYKGWSNLISPGYCWYNNDSGRYKDDYGALYNGYTVSTGKLCPAGWHVPSLEEWTTLTDFVGGKTAGGKLKERGNQYWMSPNAGATNETGFTALPGGSRGSLGSFMDEGLRGYWWSSTDYDGTDAWNRAMGYTFSNVTGSSDHKKSGLSVRCVKD